MRIDRGWRIVIIIWVVAMLAMIPVAVLAAMRYERWSACKDLADQVPFAYAAAYRWRDDTCAVYGVEDGPVIARWNGEAWE